MRNVTLITVDCLRYDVVDRNPHLFPNLERLSKKGIFFHNAFSNGSWTAFSFLSVFTGKYPHQFSTLKIPYGLSFTKFLMEHRVVCGGFHTNVWISRYMGYDKMFNVFFDGFDKRTKGMFVFKRSLKEKLSKNRVLFKLLEILYSFMNATIRKDPNRTRETTERAKEFIEKNHDKDTFLWVHFLDVHEPMMDLFANPLTRFRDSLLNYKLMYHKEEITAKDLRKARKLYLRAMIATDKFIGDIVKTVKEKYDEYMIIVTSDHGQEFFEHGDFGHNGPVYDEHIHVPLIVSYSGGKKKESNDMVELKDIGSLVKQFFQYGKVKIPTQEFVFSVGYKGERPNPITSPYVRKNQLLFSIRTKRFHFISDTKKHILFNVKEDPMETSPIKNKEVSRLLLKLLKLKLNQKVYN